MRWAELLRRELGLVFGARVTWLVLAIASLLIGHGYLLAIDLFSAASRSALEFALMRRELDPLAGVVRPTLGGLQLATTVLLPVIATRGLAIERERKSYGPLALAVGSTTRVVLGKAIAALAVSMCPLLPVLLLLACFAMLGGHVDLPETAVALLGHALHACATAMLSLAAAAATSTVAAAIAVALTASLVSWAVAANQGFAALAWLGRLEWVAVDGQLEPFDHGVIALGACAWFVVVTAAGLLIAVALARIERPARRLVPALMLSVCALLLMWMSSQVHRGYDWSEQRRASLPPSTVEALRRLPGPLRIEVFLDRDDGRRARLEQDGLAKLRLARPDLVIETPLDGLVELGAVRDTDYGRIVLHVGDETRETRSTGRRELSTLLFEAAGVTPPVWSQPPYAGYPCVIEAPQRSLLGNLVYVLVPGLYLLLGWFMTRSRRTT